MNLRGEVPKLTSYNDSKRMWCGTVRHIVPPNSISWIAEKGGDFVEKRGRDKTARKDTGGTGGEERGKKAKRE